MKEKEWTIMVYMAGDNNLSEDMITGLKGMMNFGTREKINLVALFDGSYPYSDIKFFDFTKKMPNTPKPGLKHTLEDFVEDLQIPNIAASRRPASNIDLFKIEEFVPVVINKYPAKKYALILSGHSDGVIGRTLLRDENPDIALNLISLRKVLEKALPTKNGKKRKLDLLGFDGCLMGMLEVGYELKDVAKVMVASEGNIPTTGWDYHEVLVDIIANPQKMDEKDFAIKIVEKYSDFNVDYTIGGRSVNISACNLEELGKEISLYALIQELAGIFNDLLSLPTEAGKWITLKTAKENQLIKDKFVDWMLLSHYRSQIFMHGQAVDIIDFVYNLLLHYPKWLRENEILGIIQPKKGKDKTINETINKIEERINSIFEKFIEINQAINDSGKKYILASCSVGAEYQFSQGVSLFFPWTTMALNLIEKNYNELKFNKNKKWLNFITDFTKFTLRQNKDQPLFIKEIETLFAIPFENLRHKEVGKKEVGKKEVGKKEVGKKEVGKKEVGKKGSINEFYLYFSQFQNYDPEVFKKHSIDNTSFI